MKTGTRSCFIPVIGAFAVLFCLAIARDTRADAILPGHDLLETDTGTTLDDLMLPAGFFGPGSDPFVGRVFLKGMPFDCFDPDGPGPAPSFCGLVPTDTVIRRMAGAGPTFPATIPIEIVALSLRSASPLTVTFGGGASSTLWNLDVQVQVNPLTGAVDPPQALGSMTIRHDAAAAGGTFDSLLPVTPLLTFTEVGGPGTVGPMISPTALTLRVAGESWSHSANPLLFPGDGQVALEVAGLTANFFPGCVCATCAPPREPPVCYSVDGGAFNPARNGAPLTPLPNPAEGLIVPDPRHVPPNDVYALGTSPGAPPGAPPGGHGYATEGEIFQSAGDPLGAPPNGSNVDRMSAALGVGPAPAGPPFLGPFTPNPGGATPAPPPPGVPGPPGSFGPPPGNTVGTFGLVPNDNVDALSFGRDSGNVLFFSVDPATMGVPGTAVGVHAVTSPFTFPAAPPLPTNPGGGDPGDEAAGDVFKSLPFAPFGSYIPLHFATGRFVAPAMAAANDLATDEFLLGLQAPAMNGSAIAPPEDDLDGLELSDAADLVFGVDLIDNATGIGPPDGIPDRHVFFSIDTASPSSALVLPPPVDPDDILVTPPGGFAFGVFADGTVDIGLLPGDDIDALALSDVATLGSLDPGLDEALFSLHPGSPSVLVGPDGMPGSGDEVSAADVFYTSFTGVFALYASAGALGLLFGDNLNALDILPMDFSPPGGGGGSKKKLSKEEARLAKHGIRVSQKRRCHHATRGSTYTVTIFGLGQFQATLDGLYDGTRTSTAFDPARAQTTIPTEIVSMSLTGASPIGPVFVAAGRELGLPPSLGEIAPVSPRRDVPGRSVFDMFFRIEVGGMQLHNEQPFRVESFINEFPPYGHTYQGFEPVLLVDERGQPMGTFDAALQNSLCPSDADCDDHNPCTTDTCDNRGACSHAALPDQDGDGVCDAVDCAPLDPSVAGPPGPVGNTVQATHDRVTGVTTLNWAAIPHAQIYNLYRGTIPNRLMGSRGLGPSAYDHACFAAGILSTQINDGETPARGTAFYYLPNGENRCEGSLGNASSGGARPNNAQCL
jgi:hypothetical protein